MKATAYACSDPELYMPYMCLTTVPSYIVSIYPEWPHIGKVVASHDEGRRVDSLPRLHRFILCTRRSTGAAHGAMKVGSMTCQLDLPSLTPLSVAGYGLLQLGGPHYATSVDYCK